MKKAITILWIINIIIILIISIILIWWKKDHKEIGLIGMLNAKLFVLYLIIAVVLFIILTIVILRNGVNSYQNIMKISILGEENILLIMMNMKNTLGINCLGSAIFYTYHN